MAIGWAVRNGRGLRSIGVLAAACIAALVAKPAHAQYVGQVSSFVIDASTGQVLQQYNPDLQRYPASLTKLMTLYLAFQALRDNHLTLDQAVPVSAHAASMEPSKLGLMPGSYLTVEQAILALVTKSANDAACALGEMMANGDEQHFAQLMTQQGRLLGMTNTTFRNASGLPDPEQVSTARDFAVLARRLIRDFPDQYHYFAVPAFMFHGRYIGNHDPMLRSYPGADGLKTGYTSDAGHNMVSSASRGNVRLIAVVLGARTNPQRSAMMSNLLDAGFQQEGVPIMARPMPRVVEPRVMAHAGSRRGHAAMTLVADQPHVARPIWRGRHRFHHLASAYPDRTHLDRTMAGIHFAMLRFSSEHEAHRGHFAHVVGARVRRVLAHGHHPARLRLTSTDPGGSQDRDHDV
jgi:D-alanyl-D-alanine carboxypeptidase